VVTERQKSLEQALEEAVSRALRDNLAPLQRTADDLHQAYADLVAACSSSRPSNALPAMLRAQTAASALAAGLSVLSNFVAVALNPRDREASEEEAHEPAAAMASAAATAEAGAEAEIEAPEAGPEASEAEAPRAHVQIEEPSEPTVVAGEEHVQAGPMELPLTPEPEPPAQVSFEEPVAEAEPESVMAAETAAFDVAGLSAEQQELHRRANRMAKVTMQDIRLLRPNDVRLGREQKDLCKRLRSDLDKARKEYDRRFRAILDQPVDYFHRWMVEILAEGDGEALGDYPYPSPVLRH
jgi:hypothetical protein